MVTPGRPAPPLVVPTVDGGPWRLSDQRPESFTLLAFFRGGRCAESRAQLRALEAAAAEFRRRGVTVVAVSMDGRDAAYAAYRDWGLRELPMGYQMSAEQAAAWGLLFSAGAAEAEPEFFSEPAQALVRPDGAVQMMATQSAPGLAPSVEALLAAIDTALEDGRALGAEQPEGARAAA